MTDTEEPTRCPRGHLTPSAFEYCTTCGERLTPGAEVEDVGGPPLGQSDEPARGSGARSRLSGLRRKRRGAEPPVEPPALVTPADPPSVLEPPRPIVEPARRFGGLRRKPREAKAPAEPGHSLLPDDLSAVANEPPRIPPPEVEPSPFGEPSGVSSYPDVEFAIGPGTRSVVTFDRPVASGKRVTTKRRGPEIPTRVLLIVLLVIALIAAAIIFFVAREPGTPVATLIPPTSPSAAPTASSAAPATATPTAPAVAVSEECGNAFAFAAAHAAEAQAPTLQQRTLELCATPDEWIAAARLHPTAIGESSASDVDGADLARVCRGAPAAQLCRSTPASASPSPPASPS